MTPTVASINLLEHGTADMKQETVEVLKQVGDGLSVVTVIATLIEVLPAIAALLTIVWTCLRIAESVTGKPMSELFGKKDAEHE